MSYFKQWFCNRLKKKQEDQHTLANCGELSSACCSAWEHSPGAWTDTQ